MRGSFPEGTASSGLKGRSQPPYEFAKSSVLEKLCCIYSYQSATSAIRAQQSAPDRLSSASTPAPEALDTGARVSAGAKRTGRARSASKLTFRRPGGLRVWQGSVATEFRAGGRAGVGSPSPC